MGKFVEFYGAGLTAAVADRATIGNMAPEYGATCGFFPVDARPCAICATRPRDDRVALVETYAKAQGMCRTKTTADPVFTDMLSLNCPVEPSMAGPKRPQDRVALRSAKHGFADVVGQGIRQGARIAKRLPVEGRNHDLGHGDVVIAAITSCTNTSNPSVMMGAGLLAQKAVAKGLKVSPG